MIRSAPDTYHRRMAGRYMLEADLLSLFNKCRLNDTGCLYAATCLAVVAELGKVGHTQGVIYPAGTPRLIEKVLAICWNACCIILRQSLRTEVMTTSDDRDGVKGQRRARRGEFEVDS